MMPTISPPHVDERQADLQQQDFEVLFGEPRESLFQECRELVDRLDFRYEILHGPSREEVFLRVLKTLEQHLEAAGSHRKQRWENGWAENLSDFQNAGYDLAALAPKFVRPHEIIRLRGEYIRPYSHQFEANFVKVLRHWMFEKWFRSVDYIYEFGCGTGHNLVDAAFLFPGRLLYGLDWSQASQAILRLLKEKHGFNIVGREFNMLEPDETFSLNPQSGVLTVGAMEQLGCKYHEFLNYILAQRPQICVHVETMYELYDQTVLFDYVAAKYLEKRNYLKGFLGTLEALERDGEIQILGTFRTFWVIVS